MGAEGADRGMKGSKHTSPGRSTKEEKLDQEQVSPSRRPWLYGCYCVSGQSLSEGGVGVREADTRRTEVGGGITVDL